MCETGCFDSATTTSTSITTTTTTSTTAPLGECDSSRISDSQYCYTIPDSYDYFDSYDYNYNGIEDIQTGAVITMSRICTPDYHLPGEYFMSEDQFGNFGCSWFANNGCNWRADELLLYALHTDNGYITALNCPQCGCTEDDIITLDERKDRTRTMGGGRASLKAMLEESRQKNK